MSGGISTTIAALCRRIPDHVRGTAIIEFTLIAAPFLALLLASLETALVYFTQEALETAAEAASRRILTGGAQSAGTSQTDFRKAACADLPSYLSCANLFVDVQKAATFDAVDTSAPTLTFDAKGKVTSSFAYQMGGAGDIVILRLMYLWPVATGPLGFNLSNAANGARLLVATSVAKTEPYA